MVPAGLNVGVILMLPSERSASIPKTCLTETVAAYHKGQDGLGEYYSRERFSVCMPARGWRNP